MPRAKMRTQIEWPVESDIHGMFNRGDVVALKRAADTTHGPRVIRAVLGELKGSPKRFDSARRTLIAANLVDDPAIKPAFK